MMVMGRCLYLHYVPSRMLGGGTFRRRRRQSGSISDPRGRHIISFPGLPLRMLLLLLFPMLFPLSPGAQAGEIIGGREARPHSRPYMAFVTIAREEKGAKMCGGFLIREDVVVTAAHCNRKFGNISVLLGAHNVEIDEPGTQKISVHHRIPHPEFNDATLENDIMLLQLRDKAKLTVTVGTIPLPDKRVREGAVCCVAGWGLTSTNANAQRSPTLQEVKLKVMSKGVCLSRFYPYYVPSRMLCVGDPQERNASFKGDSGGPLVCDGKAQGIVSYGRDDGSAPNVFTKVSKYVSWIKKTLRKLKP
ncbi:mast cell proteinase-3 [Chelydra serpentina]|uniref:Mast cell proteinase-3 n=1 Tax=Chelydra serpentina TaxID=8475 RepID=A0A8T1S405_CHESE|nr:mast cell proteinase-3 [Chelydra serpentina]